MLHLEVVLTCQYEGEGLGTDFAIGEQLVCVLASRCHQVVQQAVIPGLPVYILLLPCEAHNMLIAYCNL